MDRFFYYYAVANEATTIMDRLYQVGTIQAFDSDSEQDTPVKAGSYCVPVEVAGAFQDFIESLETSLPIFMSFGSEQQCKKHAAQQLLVDVGDLSKSDDYDEEEYSYSNTQPLKPHKRTLDEENY